MRERECTHRVDREGGREGERERTRERERVIWCCVCERDKYLQQARRDRLRAVKGACASVYWIDDKGD